MSNMKVLLRVGPVARRSEADKEPRLGTSLVAQWLRIPLPMQGTQVRALVREDATCHRATRPGCHNY